MNIIKLLHLFLICFLNSVVFVHGQNYQDLQKNKQDSTVILQLLSGDTVNYKLSQIETDYITGFKKKNNKNIWTFKIYPNNDVAYYTLKNHEKVWIYQPDPMKGNFLNISQMEKFISGKKNAKYYYKPLRHFIIGMAFGFTLGLIDTYKKGDGLLNDPNGTISIATPLLSSIIIRTKNYKVVSISSMTDKEILESQYKKGYASVKKIKNSIASFSGSLIGVISVFILNNY